MYHQNLTNGKLSGSLIIYFWFFCCSFFNVAIKQRYDQKAEGKTLYLHSFLHFSPQEHCIEIIFFRNFSPKCNHNSIIPIKFDSTPNLRVYHLFHFDGPCLHDDFSQKIVISGINFDHNYGIIFTFWVIILEKRTPIQCCCGENCRKLCKYDVLLSAFWCFAQQC